MCKTESVIILSALLLVKLSSAESFNSSSQPKKYEVKSSRAFIENAFENENGFNYQFQEHQKDNKRSPALTLDEDSHFQNHNARAVPITSTGSGSTSNSLPIGSSYFPESYHSSQSSYSVPSHPYSAPSHSYAAPSHLYGSPPAHPYSAPLQVHGHLVHAHKPVHHYGPPPSHLNTFELFAHNSTGIEQNSKSLLFVQPGKCSNSIEVGRVRNVEVKTTVKYGPDAQKGICVIMVYAANELNKLAIALQPVEGTTNIVPTGSWLQTNVKMYAAQAGEISPIYMSANFGPGSPALILTKSNVVLMSFVIDRAVDFFVDVSTYQSPSC